MLTHGLGPTRARVLDTLQKSRLPMTASEVAEALDLHPNSARHHLGALASAGYASRTTLPPKSTGRPRVGFSPTVGAPTVSNEHLVHFASAVLQHCFAENPIKAEEVGETAVEMLGGPKTVDEIVLYLENGGFAPHVEDDELHFTRCPYRQVFDPTLMPAVCKAHEGFLKSAIPQHTVEGLTVGPTLCIATIPGIANDPSLRPESAPSAD